MSYRQSEKNLFLSCMFRDLFVSLRHRFSPLVVSAQLMPGDGGRSYFTRKKFSMTEQTPTPFLYYKLMNNFLINCCLRGVKQQKGKNKITKSEAYEKNIITISGCSCF